VYRVNVGCAMSPTPGWRNFDNSPSLVLARNRFLNFCAEKLGLVSEEQRKFIQFAREHRLERADATRKLPLADQTADVLYSSHTLEHMDQREALAFLAEAKRVLVPGGVLRIAVPDLFQLTRRYVESRDADAFVASLLLTVPKPRSLRARVVRAFLGDRHHMWMYDGPSLVRLLTAAGFRSAVVQPPGETVIKNPGPLNLRERSHESVYVEALR
jgi:SAM-dependent methyltransferase